MSVVAADLYRLGSELMTSDDEVKLRCAIGRFYYACFHICEQFRVELSRPLPTDCGSHEAVGEALRSHKSATPQDQIVTLNRIAARLDSLRTIRHRADYRIGADVDQKDRVAAPRLARSIFNDVAMFSRQNALERCATTARL